MNSHPPVEQAPGHVTRALSFDLATVETWDLLCELGSLGRPQMRGQRVTVRVGRSWPSDHDWRVVAFLLDAIHNGVDVILDGSPSTVTSWWRELSPSPAPLEPKGRRHLKAVHP